MKVFKAPRWTMPFGEGLCLYKVAFIREDAKNTPYTIAHEYKHSLDWQEIGFFKFPYLYLVELYKKGYKENKYEVAARAYGLKNRSRYENIK